MSIGWLGYFLMSLDVDTTSFTLGFFLRVSGTETVGIYSEQPSKISYRSRYRFSLTAVDLNLELHTHDVFSYNNNTVSSFTFRKVLKAYDWQFVALSYNWWTKPLKLYDETANVIQEHSNVHISLAFTHSIYIGQSHRFGVDTFFTPFSAIAYLSLHNRVLSRLDIALLPCACQFKDRRQ